MMEAREGRSCWMGDSNGRPDDIIAVFLLLLYRVHLRLCVY